MIKTKEICLKILPSEILNKIKLNNSFTEAVLVDGASADEVELRLRSAANDDHEQLSLKITFSHELNVNDSVFDANVVQVAEGFLAREMVII